jgi:hypothetical protein
LSISKIELKRTARQGKRFDEKRKRKRKNKGVKREGGYENK